jgi:hypothetical protein
MSFIYQALFPHSFIVLFCFCLYSSVVSVLLFQSIFAICCHFREPPTLSSTRASNKTQLKFTSSQLAPISAQPLMSTRFPAQFASKRLHQVPRDIVSEFLFLFGFPLVYSPPRPTAPRLSGTVSGLHLLTQGHGPAVSFLFIYLGSVIHSP